MRELEVGSLRQQSAFVNADRRVVLIPSPKLKKLLGDNEVVLTECYPDTTDEIGCWKSTFKIKAELKEDHDGG